MLLMGVSFKKEFIVMEKDALGSSTGVHLDLIKDEQTVYQYSTSGQFCSASKSSVQ